MNDNHYHLFNNLTIMKLLNTLLILLLSFSSLSLSNENYVFGWSQIDDEELKNPRGGSSKGPAVDLDLSLSFAWEKLQENGISKFERDRRAILAMLGEYRVYFDFMETMGLTEGYSPSRPYQSWATEFVTLIEDKKDFISLQHILVIFTKKEDGSLSKPMVVKHWRQDWKYQDRNLNEYKGFNKWVKKRYSSFAVKDSWSQSVYQVDDSPRYQSYGIWNHQENISSWKSDDTWRPLPRREFSVRDDYDVLIGTNLKTITPNGWVHEQNNKKVVLDENSEILEVLAKEIGLARYERIKGHDWSAGKDYWEATSKFWIKVRDYWTVLLKESKTLELAKENEGLSLFAKLFAMADAYKKGDTGQIEKINSSINSYRIN